MDREYIKEGKAINNKKTRLVILIFVAAMLALAFAATSYAAPLSGTAKVGGATEVSGNYVKFKMMPDTTEKVFRLGIQSEGEENTSNLIWCQSVRIL